MQGELDSLNQEGEREDLIISQIFKKNFRISPGRVNESKISFFEKTIS